MSKKKLIARRVRIPTGHWTAFSTEVFSEVLPQLRRQNSARVYLAMYHHVWRTEKKSVAASFATIAKWTRLDYRTVKGCFRELQLKKFIVRARQGTLRSRSDAPTWTVPAAKFNMKKQPWVPVPSFIITDYLRLHRACTLLPLLLYYQNMKWKNSSYPSAVTLHTMIHWELNAVYGALKLMSDDKRWEKLCSALPRPLGIGRRKIKSGNKTYRYYRVLAVRYDRDDELPVVYLSEKFAKFFHIHSKKRHRKPR